MRAVVALIVILGLLVVGVWGWRVRGQTDAIASFDGSSGESQPESSKATVDAAGSARPAHEFESSRAPDDTVKGGRVAGKERPENVSDAELRGEAPSTRPKIDYTLTHDELRALALDLTLSIDERIQAASLLRYGWRGEDPRAGALVNAMIDLVAYADGEQRGHIWKALDECKDPNLVEPMLQALLHDADAGARSEAAESLGTFVSDPRVRLALQQAAANDSDDRVRKEARGSLDG